MQVVDFIILFLYVIAIACAVYIIFSHRKYFKERFRKGVVSAFMLAMLFFLSAYTFKMITAFWIRLSGVLYDRDPLLVAVQTNAWAVAQFFTTLSLVILAILTYTRRYDLFIYLKKIDRRG